MVSGTSTIETLETAIPNKIKENKNTTSKNPLPPRRHQHNSMIFNNIANKPPNQEERSIINRILNPQKSKTSFCSNKQQNRCTNESK